jgi:dipeptidyl aminopeptidase/acylaminoacyl peptidase
VTLALAAALLVLEGPATAVTGSAGSLLVARGDVVERRDPESLAPLGETRVPGFEKIVALAVSPDGKRLAIAGGVAARTGDVAILDATTLAPVVRRDAPPFADLVTTVAWSDDGSAIVAGAADRLALVLDGATLATRRELRGHTGAILGAAVQGDVVATASADGTIRVWELSTGTLRRSLTNHGGGVNGLAFEPGGRRLASASDDRTVRIWDPQTGRMLRIVREHPARVLCVAWTARGLVSGASDGTVRSIDPDEGSVLKASTVPPAHPGRWVYAVWADGKPFVVATDGGVARLGPD